MRLPLLSSLVSRPPCRKGSVRPHIPSTTARPWPDFNDCGSSPNETPGEHAHSHAHRKRQARASRPHEDEGSGSGVPPSRNESAGGSVVSRSIAELQTCSDHFRSQEGLPLQGRVHPNV